MMLSTAWMLVPLFLAVILYDLRLMRIPNWLVLLFAIVALAVVPFSVSWEETLLRAGIALAVLLIGLVLFALGLMGGGDIKLLAVLMLLVPPPALPVFGLMLSAGIVVGIVALGIVRQIAKGRAGGWRAVWDRKRFPLGLGIGLAGLAFIFTGPSVIAALA
jgi:prepilin peptidase CpaA